MLPYESCWTKLGIMEVWIHNPIKLIPLPELLLLPPVRSEFCWPCTYHSVMTNDQNEPSSTVCWRENPWTYWGSKLASWRCKDGSYLFCVFATSDFFDRTNCLQRSTIYMSIISFQVLFVNSKITTWQSKHTSSHVLCKHNHNTLPLNVEYMISACTFHTSFSIIATKKSPVYTSLTWFLLPYESFLTETFIHPSQAKALCKVLVHNRVYLLKTCHQRRSKPVCHVHDAMPSCKLRFSMQWHLASVVFENWAFHRFYRRHRSCDLSDSCQKYALHSTSTQHKFFSPNRQLEKCFKKGLHRLTQTRET